MKLTILCNQLARSCRRASIPCTKYQSIRLFSSTISNNNESPLKLFQKKIDSKQIQHDENQKRICQKLEEIHSKLNLYSRLQHINNYDNKIQPLLLIDSFDGENSQIIDEHFNEMHENKVSLNIPPSLYIHGEVGTGKTMLMDIFYECCPEYDQTQSTRKCRIHFQQFMRYIHLILYEWKLDHNKGLNVTPDHYQSAQIKIHENHNEADVNGKVKDENEVNYHRHRITKLKDEEMVDDDPIYRGPDLMQMVAKSIASEIYLLCFDEIQITDSTNLSLLSYLFCYLYQYGVIIIGTSNRNPNELFYGEKDKHLLLKPFLKTINIFSDVIHLNSDNDYRKQEITENLEENGGNLPYFIVEEDDNKSKDILNELWSKCINNDTNNVEYNNSNLISLYGRNIEIPKYHLPSSSVYFTFKQICENLYGPYDYIYIANKFENIFIENIPKLSIFTQKNEARRFIWLIDAIYESKSKIYCTSKRPLNDLFNRQSIGNEANDGKDRGSFDDFMYRETMSNIDLDEISIKNEGDERIQQISTQTKSDNIVDINDHNKSLINESIFSGEEEIFAFKRAISRIYEINSNKYHENSKHNLDNINVELFNNLKIPESIPPRNEKFGLSISEQLLVIPKRQKQVNIKEEHMYGYANWGFKGSGVARSLRERFFSNRSNDNNDNQQQ